MLHKFGIIYSSPSHGLLPEVVFCFVTNGLSLPPAVVLEKSTTGSTTEQQLPVKDRFLALHARGVLLLNLQHLLLKLLRLAADSASAGRNNMTSR